jgi:hypothetical protein
MWICEKCKEENEDNFDTCWKCYKGSEQDKEDLQKALDKSNKEKEILEAAVKENSKLKDDKNVFRNIILSIIVAVLYAIRYGDNGNWIINKYGNINIDAFSDSLHPIFFFSIIISGILGLIIYLFSGKKKYSVIFLVSTIIICIFYIMGHSSQEILEEYIKTID